MLKDLVVKLSTEGKADPAANYALSIADSFGAHLTGVAFALEPVIAEPIVGGIGSNIIDRAIAENQDAAKAAIKRFEADTRKRNLSVATQQVTAIPAHATGEFGRIARCSGLSVVTQADPKCTTSNDIFIEAALFGSGRPVVIVPYIQKERLNLRRVICCWDGSAPAARAIGDALPFLRKADHVELLVVATEKTREIDNLGPDMADHLTRLGLKVFLRQIHAADIDVGNAILSYAADNDAAFLVMGGYGHSRFREFVLGGATRVILSSMTLPVLMAH
jgi:nucleotide-binding universal stress UspA family protein